MMTTAKLHIIHSLTTLLSNLHIYKIYWAQRRNILTYLQKKLSHTLLFPVVVVVSDTFVELSMVVNPRFAFGILMMSPIVSET